MRVPWRELALTLGTLVVGSALTVGGAVALGYERIDWRVILLPSLLAIVVVNGVRNLSRNRRAPVLASTARTTALNALPEPGRAQVAVVRQGTVSLAIGADILLDGRVVAQLKSPRRTLLSLAPGAHVMEAAFPSAPGRSDAPPLALEIEAGERVVVHVTVEKRWVGNALHCLLDPDPAATWVDLSGVPLIAAEVPSP